MEKKCENCKWWDRKPTSMVNDYGHIYSFCLHEPLSNLGIDVWNDDRCKYHEPKEEECLSDNS